MGILGAFADPQFRKDVARGLLDAGNRGAVAGLLGGPVDLATMALRPLGYNVERPVGGSEWIGQKMQNLGLVSEKRNPLAEGLAAFAGPMAAQQIAPKVFAAELRAMENMAKPSPMNAATRGQAGAIVWHGSPHKFDKFDSSKIGTGEGAQAYGHGLYLAESPQVAGSYSGKLSSELTYNGKAMQRESGKNSRDSAAWALYLADGDKAAAKASGLAKPELIDALDPAKLKPGGQMYKVDLPDDQIARMLDWDKPLSQQAPEVQAMAQDLMKTSTPNPLSWMANGDASGMNMTGKQFLSSLQGGEFQMQKAGIPGIRYLDGGSRGAGTGSSNFVVFPGNENLLRILERNGQALP